MKAYKLTVLFISHDLDEALYLGDEVVFLTKRPAHVQTQLTVPATDERTPLWTTTPAFAALKKQALTLL